MDSTSATGPSPCPTPSRRIPRASGTARPPSACWQRRTRSRRQTGPISSLLMLLLLPPSPPLLSPPWGPVSPLQVSRPLDHSRLRCLPPERCLPECLLPCHLLPCHPAPVPPGPRPGLHPPRGTHLTRTPSLRAGCTIQESLPCKCTTGRQGWASITQDPRAPAGSPPRGPRLACRTLAPHPWGCHPEDLILGRPWVTQAPCPTTACVGPRP